MLGRTHFLDSFAGQGFHALALSLRGHGASKTDKPLRLCSISDYYKDMVSVADVLRPRPILIGHSLGGFLVQKYLDGNEVPAAILLASAPPSGHLPTLLRLVFRHPWRSLRFALTGHPADLAGGSGGMRALLFGGQAPEHLIDAVGRQLSAESTRAILFDLGVASLFRT
ncbi:alpha/beta fold hydrolase [Mycobacterium marseillense]|nr:alpha/beta fold hydrolase [Mycobacterium marseillense]MDM3975286.1 alpha/beta fold hydrolase [Mycobacterium marseillense]